VSHRHLGPMNVTGQPCDCEWPHVDQLTAFQLQWSKDFDRDVRLMGVAFWVGGLLTVAMILWGTL